MDDMKRIKRLQIPFRLTDPSAAKLSEFDKEASFQFYCIRSIGVSDELEHEDMVMYVRNAIRQFIVSLKDTASVVVFRILSESATQTISLWIGINGNSSNLLGHQFSAYFPSAKIEPMGNSSVPKWQVQTVVTGIPEFNEDDQLEHIESFIRAVVGRDVMLEIAARPLPMNSTMQNLQQVLKWRSTNSKNLKESQSKSKATSETYSSSSGETTTDGKNHGGNLFLVNTSETRNEGRTHTSSDTTGYTETVTLNVEQANHQAVMLDEILDAYSKRLEQSLASGLWQTAVSLYAQNASDLTLACQVYTSLYSNNAVEPYHAWTLHQSHSQMSWFQDPIRIHTLDVFDEKFRQFSFLTGEELAILFNIPRAEFNGYQFARYPRFGQNVMRVGDISLGRVYDGKRQTPMVFSIGTDQLVKHLMVSGITGSGKTSTVFNLLKSVQVPFLIIEPAKKEYRVLKDAFPNLRVYTLGNEHVSPLRMNPFYFPPSVHIQQHIDNLKVIFNASFTMYASMPNILEQCLTNVYIKKGWSLSTSQNIYQRDKSFYQWYFPTIEDLYEEIDTYTKELGYAQEQTQNIRAALLTRIKSLMTGGKGMMLNSKSTIDMGDLLQHPTVLELEAIADDDEKALVIGLISVFIYEYLKSAEVEHTSQLRHLLVFEEAHRIFANVSQHGSEEHVNIKGKSVESLSHILSEIRAYGEGMIIVDQVPTKLAPDVLKNTNTKIIHRIVSKDDCEYVAQSLAMSETAVDFISRLKTGEAIVYSDGMSDAMHLQILHGKENTRYVNDEEVRGACRSYNSLLKYRKQMHPITEIILQNFATYANLKEDVDMFFRQLLSDSVQSFNINYQAVRERIIRHASDYGFDVDMNVDEFVESLLHEGLRDVARKSDQMKKQVNKQIIIERFLESMMHLRFKDYKVHKKEYTLLEINRVRIGGELNVASSSKPGY